MAIESKMVSAVSLEEFIGEVVKAAKEGFELDPSFRPGLFGWIFEANMVRETEEAKRPGRPRKGGE